MTVRGATDPGTCMAPVSPGEVLLEEWLRQLGMSQAALARGLGVSPNRIAEIVDRRETVGLTTSIIPGRACTESR